MAPVLVLSSDRFGLHRYRAGSDPSRYFLEVIMYDIIYQIVGHTWDTGSYSSTEQQIVYYTCCALIIILTCVFIDMIYRIFRHFWR